MTTIRIGNDIFVVWKVFSRNGMRFSLENQNIRIWLSSGPFKMEITDFTTSIRGEVAFKIDADSITRYGIYKLELSIFDEDAETADATFDVTHIFQIVSTNYADTNNPALDGEVEIEPCSVLNNIVTSTLEGASAYEIAVKHGYTGTEEEWLHDPVNGIMGNGINETIINQSHEQSGISTIKFKYANGDVKQFEVPNGTGISDINTEESSASSGINTITISLSDGTEKEFRTKNGRGVASVVKTTSGVGSDAENIFTITYSDGTSDNISIQNGSQGNSGYSGAAGELEVVNNLTDGGATAALSAEQGKVLKNLIDDEMNEIHSAIDSFEKETATEDVSGKFIKSDGTEGTNSGTGYFKFAVTEGCKYAFSGGFTGTGYNIPYLVAFDEQDNCLGVLGGFMTDDGNIYDHEMFTTPTGTAYVALNYRTTLKSNFALFSPIAPIRIETCLRSVGELPVGDLDDVLETGVWILTGGNYTNLPSASKYGYLRVTRLATYVLQEFISQTGGNVYKRRFQYSGANMESWKLVGRDATMRGALPSGDLNEVVETGTWMLIDSNSYTHVPNNALAGYLRVSNIGINDWILQEFIGFSSAYYYKRKFRVGQTVEDWTQVSGGGTIINNYNTYEVTATPEITTDTNQYLAASSGTEDRTLDILTLLQTTGVCRLGPGDFYVDGVEMPDNTQIIGSGPTTKVYLVAGANKFAIKMGKHCSVKNFALIGAVSHTPASTVGTRHGILWQGNYSETEASAQQPNQGVVDTMWISNFAGGGITCINTGYSTDKAIECTNCWITSCDAGINISYWSEFHKFTNVRTNGCYYGCVNNGGNNIFVNCDFSSCKEGFLMDNSQSQSPNNSHGSAIGCVFNHSNSNAGVGIRILGCANGFVFVGCQIFFSQTVIEDSDGVTFSACNYGNVNCDISIDGGGAVLFIGNMHQEAPTISITSNDHVVFANCYVRSTGEVVSS